MELTLDQALQKGIEAHKAGKAQEADGYYTAILKASPKHPDANHNMGVLAVGVGKVEAALPFFKTALEANPKITQFWMSYIDALIKLNRMVDAKAVLEQAKNNGAKGDGFNQIANQLESSFSKNSNTKEPSQEQSQRLLNLYIQGQYQEVLNEATKLIFRFPNSVNLYNIIGAANQGLRKLDEAIEAYNEALSIQPDFADTHNNIGIILQEQGKLAEAIKAYTKALSIKPNFAEAHYNIGNALKEKGKLEEAIEAYNKVISIKPDFVEAYNNMGGVLKTQGKLDEAIDAYNKAISIKPDYAEAWNNLYFPLQTIKLQIEPDKDLSDLYPKDINSNNGKIQLSILDYRLHWGQENIQIYLDIAMKRLSNKESIIIKNNTFVSDFNKKMLPLTDQMVALVHFGRSGTGLIHSLIDGHPEVSTLPSIYFSEYFDHSNWEKIISSGWGGMIDRFMSIYDVLFDASSSVSIKSKSKRLLKNIGITDGMANVGDQKNEVLRVDKGLFRTELRRLMASYKELDSFVFFKLVHMAYDKALNDHNPKNLIFYHIHNPSTYAQLNFVRFNPNSNWLLMVREPIQNCESWITRPFRKNDHFRVINRLLTMLFDIDNSVYSGQNAVGVRLEDVKEHPRKTIPALCKWMGIEEEDSLYEMTAQGKKWWGDPSSPDFEKDGDDPFGKTSIKRKVGSIFSENDQFILRTLFYPFSVRFGYTEENEEQFENDLQKIRPMIDEMFDFEKDIAENMQMSFKKLKGSGSYLYLRSGLIERWNTLNEFNTYPNMIMPLKL